MTRGETLLGSARTGTEVALDMPFLQFGRVVRGVIQGESHPQEFIPRLVDYLMRGQMPVDRMIAFYPLADIDRAACDRPTEPRSSRCCACPGEVEFRPGSGCGTGIATKR